MWDVYGHQLYSSLAHDYPITSVAWCPNGKINISITYSNVEIHLIIWILRLVFVFFLAWTFVIVLSTTSLFLCWIFCIRIFFVDIWFFDFHQIFANIFSRFFICNWIIQYIEAVRQIWSKKFNIICLTTLLNKDKLNN